MEWLQTRQRYQTKVTFNTQTVTISLDVPICLISSSHYSTNDDTNDSVTSSTVLDSFPELTTNAMLELTAKTSGPAVRSRLRRR